MGTLKIAASLAAIAAASLAAPANAQQQADAPAAMTARDLVTLPRLGAPVVSPDGTMAIYRVTTTDDATLARSGTYYLHDLTKPIEPAIRLSLPAGAYDVQFGAGDAIHFLAPGDSEAPDTQLWVASLAADGFIGEPLMLTNSLVDIAGYKLSPAGDKAALWADIPADCPDLQCTGSPFAGDPPTGSGRLYNGEDGFYRHWDQWEVPGEFSRVFVMDLPDDGPGQARALDLGAFDSVDHVIGDTPTKPFGGAEEIAWGADGRSVFFTARMSGSQEPASTDTDLFVSALDGTPPVNLTAMNDATDTQPAPSPDGKWLAYLAMERPGYESDRLQVMLRDLATGEARSLTADTDLSFGSLAWAPDSLSIYATAQSVLDTPAYRIGLDGNVETLDLLPSFEAHIGNLTPLPGGNLLFTRDSVGGPPEIYMGNPAPQARQRAFRLTDIATSAIEATAPVTTSRFNFAGAGGDRVWGQIHKPARVEGKLPVILYVHGGPQGSFNDGWSTRWNPRVLASQGYAVVSVDFHGSTGYGQDFTDSINRDWGGKPLEDLQLGLAAALSADPQIDGERACAMGASYGGYMMNWIAGNWADRFDCLVQHDGLFDMRSFYYTTEELWFPRWDFGGSYAEQKELYERWNPVNYVENWQTPMLVITGEQDFRVPYTQGLASFTALQERGIPSQLLVFPDENHWVLGAKNSLQWHETVFAWLDRWLAPE